MILIDLQKVFDTIDYEILLQKLKAIRFSESTIALWFKSYISERIFLAKIEKKLSDFGKISCGVPQGSTVGPLWILVTVNNVREAVTSTLLLYADDSCNQYSYTNLRMSWKSKNDLMKTSKILVTGFLIANCIFIFVSIRQNQTFLHVNGKPRISIFTIYTTACSRIPNIIFFAYAIYFWTLNIYGYSTFDLNYIFYHQTYNYIRMIHTLLMFSIQLFLS